MIITNQQAAKTFGLTPRAHSRRSRCRVQPGLIGIGPVPATQNLMQRLDLTIRDFDAIELNEAFASQNLAVFRLLGLEDDAERVNANGGAIALADPPGMAPRLEREGRCPALPQPQYLMRTPV